MLAVELERKRRVEEMRRKEKRKGGGAEERRRSSRRGLVSWRQLINSRSFPTAAVAKERSWLCWRLGIKYILREAIQ
jgi:hypothetical protein